MAEQLRAWHIRWLANGYKQTIYCEVDSPKEAALVLAVQSKSDLLLDCITENMVCQNAQGLQVFEDGEWCEWYDDEGRDIDEWSEDEFDAWPCLSHKEV
jgi:hypothetical protein